MIQRTLLAVTLTATMLTTFCQDYDVFGTLTLQDVIKDYPEYSDAEAIVLSDVGSSEFIETDRYEIQFVRTRRIKILTNEGVDYADVSIPFYSDGYGRTERVTKIKAMSYNVENGALVKTLLNDDGIFSEDRGDNFRKKSFAIPKVKVGTVIEYQYTFITPFKINLPDWNFQSRIPTIWSSYKVKIIPYYSYVYIAQGLDEFDFFNSSQENYKTISAAGFGTSELKSNLIEMGMKDIPAFESESYITSTEDYIMKVDFQLSNVASPSGGIRDIITTYPNMTKELLKHETYGKYVKKSEKSATKILESLSLNNLSELERIEAIVAIVKLSISWDGQKRIFATESPKNVLLANKGNSAEINLFLVGALRAAGINADPVLLSTRGNGKINKQYPFLEFFNYSIVMASWGDKKILLDATSDYLSFDKIPSSCFNGEGLVINDEDEFWVSLSSSTVSTETVLMDQELSPEGIIKGTFIVQSTEYDGYHYRIRFDDDEKKIENHFDKYFDEISEIRTRHFDNPRLPYTIGIEGSRQVEVIGENMLVHPLGTFPMKENKLKPKKRTYPVDMVYSSTSKYDSRIKIPEGYTVNGFPKAYHLSNDLADINYKCSLEDGVLLASASATFKKPVYNSNEYARIRFYMEKIVQYFNAPVLIEKMIDE